MSGGHHPLSTYLSPAAAVCRHDPSPRGDSKETQSRTVRMYPGRRMTLGLPSILDPCKRAHATDGHGQFQKTVDSRRRRRLLDHALPRRLIPAWVYQYQYQYQRVDAYGQTRAQIFACLLSNLPPKLLVTACQRMYRPIWLLNLREKKK